MPVIEACRLCPRECGAFRDENGGAGACGEGSTPRVARAALHMWEEPCISGTRGSGTVFFTGCPLHCVYCQNFTISKPHAEYGKKCDAAALRDIYVRLEKAGAHNINLVTPTHFTPEILHSLEKPLPVPVVWNTSGYEKVETLRMLRDKVQIFLADMKYGNALAASRYSHAHDYPEIAGKAILEMYNMTGDCVFDSDGILQRGVIIRHLVLPDNLENTFDVLDWVHDNFPHGGVMFSLMGQYTPYKRLPEAPELARTLSPEEYRRASEYMKTLGILYGYEQELDSACESYTPDFGETSGDFR